MNLRYISIMKSLETYYLSQNKIYQSCLQECVVCPKRRTYGKLSRRNSMSRVFDCCIMGFPFETHQCLFAGMCKGINTPSGIISGTFEVLTLGMTLGNQSGTHSHASPLTCIGRWRCRCRYHCRWRLTLGMGIA